MKKVLRSLVPLIGMCCLPSGYGATNPNGYLPTENDFQPGDFWNFSVVIKHAGHLVRIPDLEYSVVALKNGRVVFNDYAPDFDFFYLKSFSDESRRAPEDENGRKGIWRDWPLAVGKKWRFLEARYLPTLQPPTVTVQDVAVTAFEEIKVPAGTFKAFRIEHRGKYCIGCVFLRNGFVVPNDAKLDRVADDTYWYAPEIKMDIKKILTRDDRETVIELIRYNRSR